MKKNKLFHKVFLSTTFLLLFIGFILHVFIYFILPKVYQKEKERETTKKIKSLAGVLDHKSEKEMLRQASLYAEKQDVNISLTIGGKTHLFESFTTLNVDLYSDTPKDVTVVAGEKLVDSKTIILQKKEITDDQLRPVTFQVITDLSTFSDIRHISFKLLPYTIAFSFACALILSLFYSRKITSPVQKILKGIDKMKTLEKDAHCKVYGTDEISQLAIQINDLYLNLLTVIDTLEQENYDISKKEQENMLFVWSASHDLKTPLTSLRVLLENMSLNIGPYKDHSLYLEESIRLVDHLATMVNHVLTSYEDLKQYRDSKDSEIALDSFIDDILFEMSLLKDKKQIGLTVDLEQTRIIGSGEVLKKVISNILLNAIQYTPEKGHMTITLRQSVLSIQNTCQPIDSSKLKKIFEPFYRLQNDSADKNCGSGMGLYIVKTLLDEKKLPYDFTPCFDGMNFTIDFSTITTEV